MARLIERDSALEIVRRTSGDYATAFSEIGRLPTVDAAPVVHGRWECPCCHARMKTEEDKKNATEN